MAKAGAENKVEAFAQTLRLSRRLKAPREAVFRAFTDPRELAKWFGPEGVRVDNVKIDLRPGGRYSVEFHEKDGEVIPLSGVYREVTPPQRLVMTWTWASTGMAGVETLVTIELAEADGETELILIHEKLPTKEFYDLHSQGWTSTFDCLDQLVEQGGLS
jgi:uncharacterized protein YndB with AHSA1/START domain